MTEPRAPMPLERIDLNKADDPRDVVHSAVASLAQGDAVFLATDGLCGVVASSLRPEALRHVTAAGGAADSSAFTTLLIRGADELADWVPGRTPLADRLARRVWPGAVTLVFPLQDGVSLYDRLPAAVRSALRDDRGAALQVPVSAFARDVLRLLPSPLIFRPMPASALPSREGDEGTRGADGPRLLIEASPLPETDRTTVARVDQGGVSVLRAGEVDEPTLARLSATIILFVCTGNTCRSPMAEALCKVLLAERVGCPTSELESRGYYVLSAGVAAIQGMPAAANAIHVVRARGGSLQAHASRRVSLDLVRHADHILAMTGEHLDALLDHVPEVSARARLLHPQGRDVADPVGADLGTYQRTAEELESYLQTFLDELRV